MDVRVVRMRVNIFTNALRAFAALRWQISPLFPRIASGWHRIASRQTRRTRRGDGKRELRTSVNSAFLITCLISCLHKRVRNLIELNEVRDGARIHTTCVCVYMCVYYTREGSAAGIIISASARL